MLYIIVVFFSCGLVCCFSCHYGNPFPALREKNKKVFATLYLTMGVSFCTADFIAVATLFLVILKTFLSIAAIFHNYNNLGVIYIFQYGFLCITM